jgi:uncharacterized damage-inducible protein DinB
MKKFALLAVVAAVVLPVAQAQSPMEVFPKHWKVSGELTLEVAKAMPAEKYTFKPNEEEFDFGRLMVHIGLANNNAFAIISGKPNPTPPAILATYKDPKGTFKKEDVIQFLTDSFEFGNQVMASTDGERFHMMLGPEGRKMMGLEWFWSYFTHTAHHRGQAEVYLRVCNIKPPTYRF